MKGFDKPPYSWEQRKLGQLGACKTGVGFPENEQGGEVGVPFYKVSDMNKEGNERVLASSNNYVTNYQIVKHNWEPINAPAIFFAKVGAAVLLNRKRLVFTDFLLDNNTMAYVIDCDKWDINFVFGTFEKLDLPSLIQVGALPSYNGSQVEDMNVFIPKKEEQEHIGQLLCNVDSLIALHQRKEKEKYECEKCKSHFLFTLGNIVSLVTLQKPEED